MQQKLESTWTA